MNEIKSFDDAASMLMPQLSTVLKSVPAAKKPFVQEIRLRLGRPLSLSCGSMTLFVATSGEAVYSPDRAIICTKHHICETFRRLCGYSVYSRHNQIKNGFVTDNGCRVGLCGTALVKNGEISGITDITSLNIRIARSVQGAAKPVIKALIPFTGGILIAGAPCSGKTTILRDLAYSLSVGEHNPPLRVSVVDERFELSGAVGNDGLGLCDVLAGYPKSEGIIQAIRALSPQVIVCDEIGDESDCRAIAAGANAGAYLVASIHAGSYQELIQREQTERLLATNAFKWAVILSGADNPGVIREIRPLSGVSANACA